MTVQIGIGTAPFGTNGGSIVTRPSFSFQNVGFNQYGYDVGVETWLWSPSLSCPGGTCWLTLSNATTQSGDPIYWDENSGPSMAYATEVGSIPSEAFTLSGHGGPPTTPEPSSILLFGSGILGLAGVLRRKLTH